jgi:hypothetical protein
MIERNEFLEIDGLFWESETHEWFHDKISTNYAEKESIIWGSGAQNDAVPFLKCFVVREKASGKYDRVIMDQRTNEIVFDTKELERIGFFIDQQKIIRRFAKSTVSSLVNDEDQIEELTTGWLNTSRKKNISIEDYVHSKRGLMAGKTFNF